MVFAQIIYKIFRFFGMDPNQIVQRQGIIYELNLKEGIDLSIYLLGNFQKHIYSNLTDKISKEPIILDIGANIGSISLSLAKTFPLAKVYAFEPTFYAWKKLNRNLHLNPEIASRITPIQSFVGEISSQNSDFVAFSSWPIDSLKSSKNKHQVHLGEAKEATANQISVDDFVQLQKLKKVDLIKIDTDGYELSVLKGSLKTLKNFRPIVIFEYGKYLLQEKGIDSAEYFNLFKSLDYELRDLKSHRILSANTIANIVPPQGTMDIIALPCKASIKD
jgi:FkbM family methyltransferase